MGNENSNPRKGKYDNSRYGGVKKNKLRAKVVYTVCAPMFPWLEPIQQIHYI